MKKMDREPRWKEIGIAVEFWLLTSIVVMALVSGILRAAVAAL